MHRSEIRILLVDDVRAILDEEERVLAQLGIPGLRLLRAETGTDALKLIVQERPDIVFLDLMLPDLSGEQICRVVKAKPELADTAIIIVTAKDDPAQQERAFSIGCDAYVTKPFVEEDLLSKVDVLLAERGIFRDELSADE